MAGLVTIIVLLSSIVLVYWLLGIISRPIFKEIHDHIEKHHPVFFNKLHEEERHFPSIISKFPLHHVLLSNHWKLPHDHKLREMASWYRTLDKIRDIVTVVFIIGSIAYIILS